MSITHEIQPERDGLHTHAQGNQQQGTIRDEDLH